MYQTYQAKSILNIHKHVDGGWFWDKYSVSPYLGCEYGCVYCYCRDEKYNPYKAARDPTVLKFEDPFSQYIKIKENASELLRKALKNKPKDLIYIHGYGPVDNKYQLTREILKVCLDLKFPISINVKSPLVLRDLDLLKEFKEKTYVNMLWSIITATEDETRKTFEPFAPTVEARFTAMKKLADAGILTGTALMPILPFIYDNEENIEAVIRQTKESGGSYILDGGLTLWGYCGTFYYQVLEKYNKDLVVKYQKLYSSEGSLATHERKIHEMVKKYARKYDLHLYITRPVHFYPKNLQINKKIAEDFYCQARELQISGENKYRYWAYLKAAWVLDDLEIGVDKIYAQEGIEGLIKLPKIGRILAKEIEEKL